MSDSNEPLTPVVHRGAGPTAEAVVRYEWAATVAAGRTVLDVGCGRGWGVERMAARAKAAVGVDISPPVVEEARQLRDAEFRCEDMRRLSFADGEFDVVVCFEAIERVAEIEAALEELGRVLAPGGVLLLSAVNRDVYPAGNPLHRRELGAGELRDLLAQRFASVDVYPQRIRTASLLAPGEPAREGAGALELATEAAGPGAPVAEAAWSVAAAGDGELPPPPAHVALGPEVDEAAQRSLLDRWRQRALRAEVAMDAARTELEFAARDKEEAERRAEAAELALARRNGS